MYRKKQFSLLFSCVTALALLVTFPQRLFSSSDFANRQMQIDEIASRIEARYGLNISYKDIPSKLSYDTVFTPVAPKDYRNLLSYLSLFEEEIAKYPKTYFKNSKLRGAFFVKRLFHKQRPAEGVYVYKKNYILFDFERGQKNPKQQRHTIHHELYHMIELLTIGYPGWKDPEWSTLNTKDFQYGKTKLNVQPQNRKSFSEPLYPGFVTAYAMTALAEDKAEVYACLMIESQSRLLHEWIKKDQILAGKVRLMKNFINNFCAEMDDSYWQNLFE